jgi:putative metallohydrolase (TIGR04338 family)
MGLRDSQRAKVYKAENAAFAHSPLSSAPTLPSIPDIEIYIAKVWSSKRVQALFASPSEASRPPRVGDGRGRRSACAFTNEIRMPLSTRREWVVLHELAHVINRRGSEIVAGHGWEFCATYLQLVLYMMGREHHDALKREFKARRVQFTEPRKKRSLTLEQKTALAERLRAGRLAAIAA